MELHLSQDKKNVSWKDVGWATLAYAALTAIMTYPAILHPFTIMVGHLYDPLLSLYMCREWMHSLAEGHIPVFCPDIGRPFGYPFAFTSLLQYHAVLYMLLHPFCSDTLIHNIFFSSSFILAGLGAYLLAVELIGDKRACFLAGVIYSFGAPHAMHAWAHAPTMTIQWIPLFLLFWLRLVRNPSCRPMLLAVLFFVLAACSDPYQAILCVFLGSIYLLYDWWVRRPAGIFPYRILGRWLALFCLLTLILLVPLLWPMVWMVAHGYRMSWPAESFFLHSVPFWAWLVPTTSHLSGHIYGLTYPYEAELCSYHGVFTVLLAISALVLRARFPERSYFLCAFAACVFLSWASILQWKGYSLYQYLPVLNSMRSPNRFNIPGGLMLALIAAAGFIAVQRYVSKFLERTGCKSFLHKLWEGGWFRFVLVFMSLDLCIAPYPGAPIPDLPHFFKTFPPPARDECILELPIFGPGCTEGALATYWQSYHRWPTTSGYMASTMPYHALWFNSPFGMRYFSEKKTEPFSDIVAWDCKAFLDAYKVRYVILYSPEHQAISQEAYGRLSAHLRAWMQAPPIYQDSATTVYDPRLIDSARDYGIRLCDGFYATGHSGGRAFRHVREQSRI